MADQDDARLGNEDNEPTRVIAGGADSTPGSPWARPAAGNWDAPDATARIPAPETTARIPAATSPQAAPPPAAGWTPGQPATGRAPSAAPAPGSIDPAYYRPGAATPPTQTYGGQASYPNQAYLQQGQAYPTQQYPQQYPQSYPGQSYQQQAQHPGYQQPGYYQQQYPQAPYNGGYYYPPSQPQATTRNKRWPVAVLAGIAAFVLMATGSAWVTRQLQDAGSSPTITTAPVEPQSEPGFPSQDDPQAEPGWPGQAGQGESGQDETGQGETGAAASNGVSEAQSVGVVLIAAETGSGTAAGTGMVLTADGKVLTNYHVVAGSTSLAVTIADSGSTYVASVLGFDQTKDVALLQLQDARGLETVTIDTDAVGIGDRVAAVGNANGGGELVEAAGKVTGTDQDLTVSSDSPWGNTEDLSGLIETNAGAVPGDSGGPMFDAENEVLGMTTAGSTREGTSYAVPIATALAVIDQIDTGTDAGTVRVGPAGFLGIKVADADNRSSGKTITEVVSDSPAAKAGVTAGSILTRVGDTTITGSTNLATVIRALEPGQRVSISWTTSGGAKKQATATLGSSPVN